MDSTYCIIHVRAHAHTATGFLLPIKEITLNRLRKII